MEWAARGQPRLVVALDGPASAGKSTVGSGAARRLGYRFCDTGLFYRAVALLGIRGGLDLADGALLARQVPRVALAADRHGRYRRVMVDSVDVTAEAREAAVDKVVSEVARQPEVRAALLAPQRALASGGGIIMAGRDIGTVVLPDADLKVYLDASPEERARRRCLEREIPLGGPEEAEILADLRRRDSIDSSRSTAPLRVAPDALVIMTDGLTLAGTVDALVAAVREVEEAARGWGGRQDAFPRRRP
jgi:cytidylate kinase